MNTEIFTAENVISLSKSIQNVLNRFDPLGVTPTVFAPATEYQFEADIFAKMFLTTGGVSIADIRNVGVEALRDPDWFQPEDIQDFAGELTATFAELFD